MEHLVVSMCIHEKGRSGQRYDKIRANSVLYFNKEASNEASLRKLEGKNVSNWSCDRCETVEEANANADVSAHLEESVL
jgi:hypothetical protein